VTIAAAAMLPLMTIVLPSAALDGQEAVPEPQQPEHDYSYDALSELPDFSTGDLEQPSIEDTASLGGWVWIVMFGFVMSLSLASNLVFVLGVASNQRTRREPVYLLLVTMFLVNVADYSLLSFEFSLGVDHVFPYGEAACTAYQVALRSMPILQAMAVAVLLHYTAGKFLAPRQSPVMRWPFRKPASTNAYREVPSLSSRSRSGLLTFGLMMAGMFVALAVFAIPTTYFSRIVVYEEQRYCEIDLTPVAAYGTDGLQTAVSTYYLVYSAILSYWLPLLVSLPAMFRLYRSRQQVDKSPEVSVALSASVSFFIFFLLHGSVVAARHTIDAAGISISTHQSWMLKVIQSLFWLVAYFWHFARAALAVLLDPDLKDWVMHPTVANCLCCRSSDSPAEHADRGTAPMACDRECQMPLCFVMQSVEAKPARRAQEESC
jgi:hypothetical protein